MDARAPGMFKESRTRSRRDNFGIGACSGGHDLTGSNTRAGDRDGRADVLHQLCVGVTRGVRELILDADVLVVSPLNSGDEERGSSSWGWENRRTTRASCGEPGRKKLLQKMSDGKSYMKGRRGGFT